MNNKRHGVLKRFSSITKSILIVIACVWSLWPLLWLASMSLKKRIDVQAMPPKWIWTPVISNYQDVISSPGFFLFLVNSIMIGMISTFVVLFIATPAAYTLSRVDFSRKKDIDFWVLTTRMAPPIGVLIPYFLLFRKMGLLGTRTSLIIAHCALNLPLAIWILKGFFRQLPEQLEEAAFVDGCGRWRAFTTIILPLVAPGMGATGILCFLFSWNEFMFALILSSVTSKTLPVSIYNLIARLEIHWGEMASASMIILAPVIVFLVITQKQIVKGLTFGALR